MKFISGENSEYLLVCVKMITFHFHKNNKIFNKSEGILQIFHCVGNIKNPPYIPNPSIRGIDRAQ